jgi:hypothetical protein
MGLLDNTSQNQYYNQNVHGDYQFTSLDDIITQFEIAYVGENKIISKVKRADIAFHAQRALQELSFDTFKSVKSQQIDLPPSLIMPLPQDYVNYTKLSWVDESGIKHPMYPTKDTNNPFQIKQNDDGSYFFGLETNIVNNFDFTSGLSTSDWVYNNITFGNGAWDSTSYNANGNGGNGQYKFNYILDSIQITNQELEFSILWHNNAQNSGGSKAYGVWQELDVSAISEVKLIASATSGARQTDGGGNLLCDYGVVRVGLTSTNPGTGWTHSNGNIVDAFDINPYNTSKPSPNADSSYLDLGFVEWLDGSSSQKEIEDIDVSGYQTVWVYIQSSSPWQTAAVTDASSGTQGGTVAISPTSSTNNTHQKNIVSEVQIVAAGIEQNLITTNADKNSSTWNKYKAGTPSENINDNYEDDVFWPYEGRRYGLDPSNAQVNGSFYIDQRLGKIHFSSNISGKTIVLDYISDSLGTDEEMKVHKFAEEAMYKCIAHAILSTRANVPEYMVHRFKRERFAEIRKAKLRLSNIKLEEITQILRGKSKQIKH